VGRVALADLSPEQRRLVVHGYVADAGLLDEGAPRLAPETVAALKRAELALCSELSEEERNQELELWHEHLNGLSEAEEDAAIYRLASFVAILGGLRATSPRSNGAGRVVGPEEEDAPR
jgi:hypothetical protein